MSNQRYSFGSEYKESASSEDPDSEKHPADEVKDDTELPSAGAEDLQNLVLIDDIRVKLLNRIFSSGADRPRYPCLRSITLSKSCDDLFNVDITRLRDLPEKEQGSSSSIEFVLLVGVPTFLDDDEHRALKDVRAVLQEINIELEVVWGGFGYESYMESLFGEGCLRYLAPITYPECDESLHDGIYMPQM